MISPRHPLVTSASPPGPFGVLKTTYISAYADSLWEAPLRSVSWVEGVLASTCALDADQISLLCRSEDLLPDWYDEWADTESECFRQLRCTRWNR